MFFWGLQVVLSNTYIDYKRHMEVCKLTMQAVLGHYEFHNQVDLTWIDPHKYWPKYYWRTRQHMNGNTREPRLCRKTSPKAKMYEKLTASSLGNGENWEINWITAYIIAQSKLTHIKLVQGANCMCI